MKFGSVGAVIASAGRDDTIPLLKIGTIPILRRIVLTMQMAGVFPVVVVTGTEEVEVTHLLSSLGVIFIRNTDYPERPELFSSVRCGLEYIEGKCDRVFFSPVNSPMFTPSTLTRLMESDGDIVTPTYKGKGGHPILIRDSAIPALLSYNGTNGLREAVAEADVRKERIEVDDRGIHLTVHNEDELWGYLTEHNSSLLSPSVTVSIDKESVILNARLNLLLFLIDDMHSIRQAAMHMGLSYQKAWEMINTLESEAGYQVVERRRGGKDGGRTSLTEKGRALIKAFQGYEEELHAFSEKRFREIFITSGLIR